MGLRQVMGDVVLTGTAASAGTNSGPIAPAGQAAASSLGVLLVLYGYFAYSFARFTGGTAKISGTGLIAPSF